MPLNTGTFAKVAEAIKPAVVNITTTGRTTGPTRTPFEEFFGEEFFRRFFGDAPERSPQRPVGSGVIVDASGIALTNAHVVENAKDIEVVTLDGNKHRAKLVGLDKRTDLAVLKLDDGTTSFNHARLGDSDKIQVGDWVIAVGSPFGLHSTVTAGIVSAKARQLGQTAFDDFIQTDAAINPGNSGGPLVNMQGEVIGINTAIFSASGGSVGIGFAIPSNLARKIYTELNAKGKVTRGWLGVSIQPLTPELAKSFGSEGHEGSPDLRRDRRTARPPRPASSRATSSWSSTARRWTRRPTCSGPWGSRPPGATAKMKVVREKRERTIDVKVGEVPEEREVASRPGQRGPSSLGMEIRAVTPEIARQLNLRSADGVVVVRVDDESPAAAAGVQRGDVIREINRERIRTLGDFEKVTKGLKDGDRMTVLLQRGPMSLYVAFTVGRG